VRSITEAEIEWQRFVAPGIRMGHVGRQIVVDWRGGGRLVASADGRDHVFSPDAGADAEKLAKFRATGLLACRRYLEGNVSLHGSAVRLASGGALVLVGDSGAGKSTTAMALVEQEGAAFLADDIVPLDWRDEIPLVSPVDDAFWLDPAALGWLGVARTSTEKLQHPPRARATGPERLLAIVELTFDDQALDPTIEPIVGQEAFLVISRAHVCYSTGQPNTVIRDLSLRARTAVSAPLLRLRRRRSFDDLASAATTLAGLPLRTAEP
jgi:hypothetical protein